MADDEKFLNCTGWNALKQPQKIEPSRNKLLKNSYLDFIYSRFNSFNQHCKKCTPVSQPKTILITNFPANMFLVCIRNNICTAPYLSAQKLHSQTDLEIKYLYILVNLRKKTFVPESYLVVWEGGGLNNFL